MQVTTPSPAIAVERSADRKLSLDESVSATWVAQGSCPKTCPFMGNGCYTEQGRPNLVRRRLNLAHSLANYTPEQLARFEADAIATLRGKFPLRLHILGDARTRKAARIIATAANKYRKTYNKPVWTYTHAHNVPREIWGDVSILRSCENMEQVKQGHTEGYACALVRNNSHESHRVYDLGDGYKGVPCPQQTGKAESCVKCQLCWKDKTLHAKKMVIVFSPDRGTHKKLAKTLPMAQ